MRAPDRPIARINGSGYGLEIAAGRAEWYVIYEGPQSLFVDDDGAAFCLPQGCTLMLRWIEVRQAWWVGNFTVHHGEPLRRLILSDLRERLRELRALAA
jgi:hypothetical protein